MKFFSEIYELGSYFPMYNKVIETESKAFSNVFHRTKPGEKLFSKASDKKGQLFQT